MTVRDYQQDFRTQGWVYNRLREALEQGEGLSLIRIGDGETRAIGHNDLIPMGQIPDWIRYAGVELPNEKVKKQLVKAIRDADIVGLPREEYAAFKPLMLKIIRKYRLNLETVCSNRINYQLFTGQLLTELIKERKIIIVGRKARDAVGFFSQFCTVSATYNLENINQLEGTYHQLAANTDFELALVAAGVPAVILCPRIARNLGKVAIDLGHVIDSIVNPEQDLLELMDNWLKKNKPHQRGRENEQKNKYYYPDI